MKYTKALTLLALLFCSVQVLSDELGLYETQILVRDNDRNNPDYLKQALAQVLSNQSGQPIAKVLNNPVLGEVNIRRGVKRSYFERVPHEFKIPDSEYQFWYRVVMKEDFIDRLMIQGEFDLWPQNRKSSTIWLAEELEDGNLQMSQDPRYHYWINEWAKGHQLNVIIPVNSDEDVYGVNPFMIKNLSHYLTEYSKDVFNSDLVAAIYIQPSEDEVKFRYGLSMDESEYLIRHVTDLNENLASNFYQVLADLSQFQALSERIEHQDVQPHTVQLLIQNLDGYQDVLDLEKYLNSLSVVDGFEIVKATLNTQTLRAKIKVTNQAFSGLIEKDGIMTTDFDGSIHQLVFNWN